MRDVGWDSGEGGGRGGHEQACTSSMFTGLLSSVSLSEEMYSSLQFGGILPSASYAAFWNVVQAIEMECRRERAEADMMDVRGSLAGWCLIRQEIKQLQRV
jgi:hypothetical protein